MINKCMQTVSIALILVGCGNEDPNVADSDMAPSQLIIASEVAPIESWVVADVEPSDSIGSSCSEVLDYSLKNSTTEFAVALFSKVDDLQWARSGYATPYCYETAGEELCKRLGGDGPQLAQIEEDPLTLKQVHNYDCKVEYVIEGNWSDLNVITRYPNGCGSDSGEEVVNRAMACSN